MTDGTRVVTRGDVSVAVTDRGGDGPPLLLLHGLAGSSRELLPTADALRESFRVLLMDQRGHGGSTRRPTDLSREAFVGDVVAVLEQCLPGERCTLVGQSMGAHTAFLTAAARPDLVERLVMLEGHVAGSADPDEAARLGRFFASWPTPFVDRAAARAHLGHDAVVGAWVDDLEVTADGLRPCFDADVMERTIAAVHVPRWAEWAAVEVPTLAVFAADGMFSAGDKDELIRRRPATDRVDLVGGSHDAHLDAFDLWVEVLRAWLVDAVPREPAEARNRRR
jgi:pimeloyl-ACP methyl ester carboxylesterase